MHPDTLTNIIAFESGGNPQAVNRASGASGLNQFMPGTARRLGTTHQQIRRMPFKQQLGLVDRYFQRFRGRIQTKPDAYMAVLYPAAIGKPNEYALFRRGTLAYSQNAGLDLNHDGVVTKAEAAKRAGVIQ